MNRLAVLLVLTLGLGCFSRSHKEDLDTLGNAIISYHQNTSEPLYGSYLCNGKPMISWRVLVVPYLFKNDFFSRYDTKSSWDSNSNSLLQKNPGYVGSFFDESHDQIDRSNYVMVIPCPGREESYGGRYARDVAGDWSVINGNKDKRLVIARITNFCEHWMKPIDLSLEELRDTKYRKSVSSLIVLDFDTSSYSLIIGNAAATEWLDLYAKECDCVGVR